MDHPVVFGLVALVSLLGLVHPGGAVPVFRALTEGWEPGRREAAARQAAGFATVLLAVAGGVGLGLARGLELRLPGLQGLAGLVLLLASMDLLRGRQTVQARELEKAHRGIRPEIPGYRPLGAPVLAGGGSLLVVAVLPSFGAPGSGGLLAGAIAATGGVTLGLLLRAARRPPGSASRRTALARGLAVALFAAGCQVFLGALRNAHLASFGP